MERDHGFGLMLSCDQDASLLVMTTQAEESFSIFVSHDFATIEACTEGPSHACENDTLHTLVVAVRALVLVLRRCFSLVVRYMCKSSINRSVPSP